MNSAVRLLSVLILAVIATVAHGQDAQYAVGFLLGKPENEENIIVARVFPSTAAETAGIEVGDQIVRSLYPTTSMEMDVFVNALGFGLNRFNGTTVLKVVTASNETHRYIIQAGRAPRSGDGQFDFTRYVANDRTGVPAYIDAMQALRVYLRWDRIIEDVEVNKDNPNIHQLVQHNLRIASEMAKNVNIADLPPTVRTNHAAFVSSLESIPLAWPIARRDIDRCLESFRAIFSVALDPSTGGVSQNDRNTIIIGRDTFEVQHFINTHFTGTIPWYEVTGTWFPPTSDAVSRTVWLFEADKTWGGGLTDSPDGMATDEEIQYFLNFCARHSESEGRFVRDAKRFFTALANLKDQGIYTPQRYTDSSATPTQQAVRTSSPSIAAVQTSLQQFLNSDHPQITGRWDTGTNSALQTFLQQLQASPAFGEGWDSPNDGAYTESFAAHVQERLKLLAAEAEGASDALAEFRKFFGQLDQAIAEKDQFAGPLPPKAPAVPEPQSVDTSATAYISKQSAPGTFIMSLLSSITWEVGDEVIRYAGNALENKEWNTSEVWDGYREDREAFVEKRLAQQAQHPNAEMIGAILGLIFSPLPYIVVGAIKANNEKLTLGMVAKGAAAAEVVEGVVCGIGEYMTFGKILYPGAWFLGILIAIIFATVATSVIFLWKTNPAFKFFIVVGLAIGVIVLFNKL